MVCAISGHNSVEWAVTDFAAMIAGALSVGLHMTSDTGTVAYIVANAGATVLVCEADQASDCSRFVVFACLGGDRTQWELPGVVAALVTAPFGCLTFLRPNLFRVGRCSGPGTVAMPVAATVAVVTTGLCKPCWATLAARVPLRRSPFARWSLLTHPYRSCSASGKVTVCTPLFTGVCVGWRPVGWRQALSDCVCSLPNAVVLRSERHFFVTCLCRGEGPATQWITTDALPGVCIVSLVDWVVEEDDAIALPDLHATAPSDLVTLLYTSGTSGTPKGVMVSAGSFLSDINQKSYAEVRCRGSSAAGAGLTNRAACKRSWC